jgi:hypothetical protein
VVLVTGSVTTTFKVSPSAGAGNTGEQEKAPAPSATVVHKTLPVLGSSTEMIPPGIVVPLTGSPLLGSTVGAFGALALASTTVVLDSGLSALPASVAVALTVVPVAKALAKVQLQFPEVSATSGALLHTTGADRLMLAPTAALPLITKSSSSTVFKVGAKEVVLASTTEVTVGSEVLLAESVTVTLTSVGAVKGKDAVVVHDQLPAASTITGALSQLMPTTFMVVPGSAVPVTGSVVVVMGSSTAGFGAV